MVSWQDRSPEMPPRPPGTLQRRAGKAWRGSWLGRQALETHRTAQELGGQTTVPGAIGWAAFIVGWCFWVWACPAFGLGTNVLLIAAAPFWALGIGGLTVHELIILRKGKRTHG